MEVGELIYIAKTFRFGRLFVELANNALGWAILISWEGGKRCPSCGLRGCWRHLPGKPVIVKRGRIDLRS